jgi:hypothetical protein
MRRSFAVCLFSCYMCNISLVCLRAFLFSAFLRLSFCWLHTYRSVTNMMKVLKIQRKGKYLNTLERYRLQMNDTCINTHNPIFEIRSKQQIGTQSYYKRRNQSSPASIQEQNKQRRTRGSTTHQAQWVHKPVTTRYRETSHTKILIEIFTHVTDTRAHQRDTCNNSRIAAVFPTRF